MLNGLRGPCVDTSGGLRCLHLDFGYRVNSQRSTTLSLNICVCLEKLESLLVFGLVFKEREKIMKFIRSGCLVLVCACDPCFSLPSFPSGPAGSCSTPIWRPATRSRQTSSRRRVSTRCTILTRTATVRRPASNSLHFYGFQRINELLCSNFFSSQTDGGNKKNAIFIFIYEQRKG